MTEKIEFTKSEFETLTKTTALNKLIQSQLIELDDSINECHADIFLFDRKVWELEKDIVSLKEDIVYLKDQYSYSTFKCFWKRNWWKLGAFLITLATIFGALGDFLYHLPPPK